MYPMFPQAPLTCGCSWIDSQGNPTDDNHPAIAMAVCYDPRSFGGRGCNPFPICEKHAVKKGKWWKLLPLPGKTVEDSHEMVVRDHVNFPKVPSDIVIEAIKKGFPQLPTRQLGEILDSLRYDHIMGNFYFQRWGMYIGVEESGHIHT